MKISKRNIFILTLLIIFIIMSVLVKGSDKGILFDYTILDILHKNTNIFILEASKIISFLGSYVVISAIVIVLFFYLKRNKSLYKFKFILFNSLGVSIINYICKITIARVRPLSYFRIGYKGLSFPSGHSMVNMSFILAITYLFNNDNKKYINIISYIYIILMGLSRLYLGVHWPTDVLGGYILGWILFTYSKYKLKNNDRV